MQFKDLNPAEQAALIKRINSRNAQVKRLIAQREKAAASTASALKRSL